MSGKSPTQTTKKGTPGAMATTGTGVTTTSLAQPARRSPVAIRRSQSPSTGAKRPTAGQQQQASPQIVVTMPVAAAPQRGMEQGTEQKHTVHFQQAPPSLATKQEKQSAKDKLEPVVNSLKQIVVAVVGDKKTGKSKLIEALRGKPFEGLVPTVVPIASFPPGLAVVDTSCRPEGRDDLIEKVTRASAIVLVYSPDEPHSLPRLGEFWMPFLRSVARKPVVLVSAKDDLRTGLEDEAIVGALMDEFEEIEIFMPVSAKERRNVTDLFLYATQAVIYTQLHSFVKGVEDKNALAMAKEHEDWATEKQSLEAMIAVASAEREAYKASLIAEGKQHSQIVKQLEDRVSELTVHEEMQMSQVLQRTQQESQLAMANMAQAHEAAMKKLEQEWSTRCEEAKARLQRTLKAQAEEAQKMKVLVEMERDSLVKTLQTQLTQSKAMAEKLQEELRSCRQSASQAGETFDYKIQEVHQRYRREMQELKSQHEKEIDALKLGADRRLIDGQRDLEREVSKRAEEVANVKVSKLQQEQAVKEKQASVALERKQSEYDRLLEIRKSLESKVEELHKKIEEIQRGAQDAIAESVKDREVILRREREDEVAKLVQAHNAALAQARDEYLREKESFLRTMRESDAVKKTMADRDEARGREMASKEEEIHSLREELRLVKLELHNRPKSAAVASQTTTTSSQRLQSAPPQDLPSIV